MEQEEKFIVWLQGFLELSDTEDGITLSQEQVRILKEKIKLSLEKPVTSFKVYNDQKIYSWNLPYNS